VVAIGGGTGLPIVLEGLKRTLFAAEGGSREAEQERLTAIVTPTDDGGSSGRLRRAYGVMPPGDVRNCLLALADDDGPMRSLFRFRFGGVGDLAGHSLGNLILTALSLARGGFSEAAEQAGRILSVRGRVLPATLRDVVLVAELMDGRRVRGETAIVRSQGKIRSLRLEPEDAELPRAVEDAIRAADLVVVGPGSLYTSLLPPLLIRGLPEAVADSGARVVLVMNLMTERGETGGFAASDHVREIRRHAPRMPIHDVLLNNLDIPEETLARYRAEAAEPVACESRAVQALGCRAVPRGLLAGSTKLRHDPRALAAALMELASVPLETGQAQVTR
jgi:uncharacterized cofD-like protein